MSSSQKEDSSKQKANPDSKSVTSVFWLSVCLSLAFMIWVGTRHEYRQDLWDTTTAGVFGDLLSGILGPILSLVGIYFVVLAIREQRKTTLEERKAEQVAAFEERFYRLIDMHRANVSEMSILSQVEGVGPAEGKKSS